jgi:hypothetical protein
MRPRWFLAASALVFATAFTGPALGVGPNERVTADDTAGSYLRYDGSSDATMAACSTGRRSQNEPTVAVDPHDTSVVVAGSNDYCAAIVNGDTWAGYYRSTDGGSSWQDSLVPGYPADTSAGGTASPAYGSCGAAGDPSQGFDNDGRLFYAFICFNRGKPVNGGVYVARYTDDGATYDRTVLVKKGTPSALFAGSGLFQDKINLAVDQTAGPNSGNVYVAWSQYTGQAGNNAVLVSRSTDHGLTFSHPVRVAEAHGTASFADLAVGPDGAVYVTFIDYPSSSNSSAEIRLAKSTDGGLSFGPAVVVASIVQFDSSQYSGNGFSDCGDGPFACPTGFTFSRFFSSSAVAADATGVHVVWAARTTDGGQSKVFVRNSPDGVSWPTPAATLDTVAAGHQWFPDVASSGGTISVVFYDSRADPAYSPDRPPGNTAGGVNSGDVVNTYVAQSTNGGTSWSETQVSSAGSNFGWETHGSRRVGFWGDYLYISAVGSTVKAAWTDSRDLVPGTDPRETGADDDADGFDVYQPCTYVPNDINAPSYSSPLVSDPCLSQGGLDQNIYAVSP